MFPLFSNKKKGVESIILDIQSGLVRGALVVNNENEPIHITSVITKSISGKTHIMNAEHLTKRVLKLITEVVEHLMKNSDEKKIANIDYILSSPWIFSKLKTTKINYDKETEITVKILEDIVRTELKSENGIIDTKAVEQKIFEIRLNGYPTTLFEGKKAHRLEVSFSTSFSSKNFLEKLNSIVDKYTNTKVRTVHSALLMQYTALRELLKDKNEFIYIHIHNELTDMIIVKDGLCKHLASFPFGISSLLRKIASKTKNEIETSDSLLSLFQGDKLSIAEKNNIQKIISPLVQEWGKECVKSFEEIFDVTNIPKVVYLSAHSHFDLFKDVLVLQNKYNFDVQHYDSLSIEEKVVFEKGVAQSNMMKIYALALFDNN